MLQQFLVTACGMHPRDAESIFSSKKTPSIRRLLQVCREVTVRAGRTLLDDEEAFGAFTGGGTSMEGVSDQRNLDRREAWERAILKYDGWYDIRAMELLAQILGMVPQIVIERGSLTDVDGLSYPLERAGCVLHDGRHHFEFIVHNVSCLCFHTCSLVYSRVVYARESAHH